MKAEPLAHLRPAADAAPMDFASVVDPVTPVVREMGDADRVRWDAFVETAPTGTFFLGVFLYHEPFTRAHLTTFALIWTAVAIFTWEMIRLWRTNRANSEPIPPIEG